MSFVDESDLPQEVDVIIAATQEPAAVELPCLLVGLGQRLVDGHLIGEQLVVSSGQPVSCGLAAAQFLASPPKRFVLTRWKSV